MCIQYKVGEETVCCPKKAEELAKGDAKAIKFVVANKEYATKGEALTALNTELDNYMSNSMKVSYSVGDEKFCCSKMAGEKAKKDSKQIAYRVASFEFKDEAAANNALKAAKEAAEKVSMKMIVDGKETVVDGKTCAAKGESKSSCPMSGGETKTVEYVVGDTKTCCKVTAEVEFKRAQLTAAIEVLEKASKA
jgi:hypothetical protein